MLSVSTVFFITNNTGRTVRVRIGDRFVPTDEVSEFLTQAVQAAFDWVSYEANSYVRLSVIPDSEFIV